MTTPARAPVSAPDTTFLGHPRGLATLFATELFERFTYYGLRALLVLFLVASTDASNAGFGFDRATATAIYGVYTGAVYLGSLPGGWIADRLIGRRNAIFWGGVLIATGNFTLALPGGPPLFYAGLCVITLGVGLLKPNISALVGELYEGQPGARRDAGFSIFYMGINLGAVLAPLVAGTLGEGWSWRAGFFCAGLFMSLGVVQFLLTQRHLGTAGVTVYSSAEERKRGWTLLAVALGTGIAVATLLLTGVIVVSAGRLAQLFGIAMIALAVAFFGYVLWFANLTPRERRRVGVIAIFFLCAALFWAGFEQAATTFTLFAQDLTDRSLLGHWFPEGVHPAAWYQAVNPICVVIFAPFFAYIWVRLGARHLDPSAPIKFALALLLVGTGFLVMMLAAQAAVSSESRVAPAWLLLTYLLHTFAELCLSPVGLSNVTKLAPPRFVGQMMGVWFLGMAIGNLFAGMIGGKVTSTDPAQLPQQFLSMALIGGMMGLLMLTAARPLRRWMGYVT